MPLDFEKNFAASNRIKTTDAAHRAETLGPVLAVAAPVLLAMAIWANWRLPPERQASPFQMQSALVAP